MEFVLKCGYGSPFKVSDALYIGYIGYIRRAGAYAAWSKGWERKGWESVQLPDSFVEEAVHKSGGGSTEAPVPPPRWKEAEEFVGGVAGVTHNAECFAGEAVAVYVQEGGG